MVKSRGVPQIDTKKVGDGDFNHLGNSIGKSFDKCSETLGSSGKSIFRLPAHMTCSKQQFYICLA